MGNPLIENEEDTNPLEEMHQSMLRMIEKMDEMLKQGYEFLRKSEEREIKNQEIIVISEKSSQEIEKSHQTLQSHQEPIEIKEETQTSLEIFIHIINELLAKIQNLFENLTREEEKIEPHKLGFFSF